MANDVHYITIGTVFFLLLGLIAPYYEDVIGSTTQPDIDGVTSTFNQEYTDTSAYDLILNLFLFPFWTFGFPAWINLWLLLWFRIVYIFIVARNIWVGGGG